VYLKDPDGKLMGKGFAESVYYADPHPNMFHLSGLPDTQKMRELVKPPSPSALLKLKGFLYLLRPSRRMRLKKVLDKCIEQGLPTSFIG
jgi:hypothetical protein